MNKNQSGFLLLNKLIVLSCSSDISNTKKMLLNLILLSFCHVNHTCTRGPTRCFCWQGYICLYLAYFLRRYLIKLKIYKKYKSIDHRHVTVLCAMLMFGLSRQSLHVHKVSLKGPGPLRYRQWIKIMWKQGHGSRIVAGQHSLNYPPSFLFLYLERLVRSLVYLYGPS